MIRIVPDQSGQIERAANIKFTFDGRAIAAHEGETVLVALTRAGVMHLRDAPVDGAPRGAFCCMGLCQECLIQVNGGNIESCRQTVSEGMAVKSLRRRQNA